MKWNETICVCAFVSFCSVVVSKNKEWKKAIIWNPLRLLFSILKKAREEPEEQSIVCFQERKAVSLLGAVHLKGCWGRLRRNGGRHCPQKTWAGLRRKEQGSKSNGRKAASQRAGQANMSPVTAEQRTSKQFDSPLSAHLRVGRRCTRKAAVGSYTQTLVVFALLSSVSCTQTGNPCPFPSSTLPFTQSHKPCKWPLLGLP